MPGIANMVKFTGLLYTVRLQVTLLLHVLTFLLFKTHYAAACLDRLQSVAHGFIPIGFFNSCALKYYDYYVP